MMLWFALLLLLFRAPGSESRLLPEDQLRAAKGLCEEEAVSDSLISSAATFFASRPLLSGSDQLLEHVNDLNVRKPQESRLVMSEKELPSELASIQAPSGRSHLVVEDHPASSLDSHGNSLGVEHHDNENRVPPAHNSQKEHFSNLASSSNSVPSEGGHRLTVEEQNRAPPSFQFESLASVPSKGGHLVVEKRNRSPPSSKYESLVSGPSVGGHLVVEKRNRSPPSSKYESLISVPSGGGHLVVEKKSHRSPTGEFQTLVSEPSGETHRLTAQREVSKKTRSPPAAGVDSESDHVTGDREGLKNREILMNLAGTPSPVNHVVAEGFGKLTSAPRDATHMVVENVERNTSPSASSTADSDQDELRSVTRQRYPPAAADHQQRATELTDSESSVDTSQKVGCSDSIWDSFDNMVQQFANSVRRISVIS